MLTQPALVDQVNVAPSLAKLNIHLSVLCHGGMNVLTVVDGGPLMPLGLTSLISLDLSHNPWAALPPLLGQRKQPGNILPLRPQEPSQHRGGGLWDWRSWGILSTTSAAIALGYQQHNISGNTYQWLHC